MELTTIFISAIVSLIIVLLNNHFNTKNIKLRNNNSIDIEKNKFKYQNFHKNHERLLINAEKLHKILSKLQRDNSPSSSYQTFYRYTIKQLDNEYDNLMREYKIREKWERRLGLTTTTVTEEYLEEKYNEKNPLLEGYLSHFLRVSEFIDEFPFATSCDNLV